MTILLSVFLFIVIFVANLICWGIISGVYAAWAGPTERSTFAAIVWMGSLAALATTCMEFAAGWVPPL